MDLKGTNALFGASHKEQCTKPLGQRDFAALKYGLYGHGELFAALGALVEAGTVSLTIQCLDLGLTA